jgi:spermidine synthase
MIRFCEKEPYAPVEYNYEVEKVLYKGKTQYQDILVIENPHFGKMLILDGIVQLTERDEFFYHEMLTHVVMHAHPNPRRVIVIGGGDGGVVREVLKHETVEKLYFVEIDERVIEVSKKYFPTVSCSVDDPRVDINIMDGAEFIREVSTQIDVIIVDSTDIIGFARSLFTKEFFASVQSVLTDEGMFVTHCESLHFHMDIVIEIQHMLMRVFPVVDLYTAPIATYPGNWWAFTLGSKKIEPRETCRRVTVETRYYDQEVHVQAFMPRQLYGKLLNRELGW